MIASFEAMLGWRRSASSVAAMSSHCGATVPARSGDGNSARMSRCGRPSCRKWVSSRSTVVLPWWTCSTPSPVKVPSGVALDAVTDADRSSRDHVAGSTASTIRSCASLSHTSHGRRPGYFSGAWARSTSAPMPFGHLADRADKPPAAASR
jgi:hypothetical protein